MSCAQLQTELTAECCVVLFEHLRKFQITESRNAMNNATLTDSDPQYAGLR